MYWHEKLNTFSLPELEIYESRGHLYIQARTTVPPGLNEPSIFIAIPGYRLYADV